VKRLRMLGVALVEGVESSLSVMLHLLSTFWVEKLVGFGLYLINSEPKEELVHSFIWLLSRKFH